MKKTELKINLNNKKLYLSLEKDTKKIDEIVMGENKKISSEFLPNLDVLLRRNNLRLELLSNISFQSDIPSGLTSKRIAQTIKNILIWSKDNVKK